MLWGEEKQDATGYLALQRRPRAADVMRAAEPFAIARLALRNRLVGTAHGRGIVEDGLPLPEDAEYWRRRAAGGAAMVTVGGTVTARESTWRRRITTEAWRPEAVPGMAARAEAIRAEGAVAACQLVHLGRETTGAEQWFHPVAATATRSPREPTRARVLSDGELDAIVEGFRVSAANAIAAGFEVVELHAAHGYLLAQFLSAPGRTRCARRAARAHRARGPRLRAGGGRRHPASRSTTRRTCLPRAAALADYVNVTVGQRTTYVRDMATEEPPLLAGVARLRDAVDAPLLVSQAFRTPAAIEAALAAGADLVGMARALIADPDMPRKLLAGRAAEIRPCVACNEDCRAFDPVLLCSVNPALGPPGEPRRPAAPLVVRRGGDPSGGRVAIVGAGPAGLECALTLAGRRDVVVFDAASTIGGALATAAAAPFRSGWLALLDFYAVGLRQVELRLGAPVGRDDLAGFDEIVRRDRRDGGAAGHPGHPARGAHLGHERGRRPRPAGRGRRLRLVAVRGAVERGVRAGFDTITVATPAAAFGATLPAEPASNGSRACAAHRSTVRPFTAARAPRRRRRDAGEHHVGPDQARAAPTRSSSSASASRATGARSSRRTGDVRVIGDALVPRKVAHAIAEGRAAGEAIARSRPHAAATATR